ncbi:MAG: replicative DNA helicase [SAR324 cluster bacterium]|nr:replicative DNA helicase [SAR324 cluster bacterium]MCZ6843573.1 replicative DNA helicase [SAR324 cluster bacterium]
MRAESLLPHDKEAEQGVLGAIIHNNDALNHAAEILQPEFFFSPAHRELFQAMIDLADRQNPIDEITLGDALRSRNLLDQVGGLIYIAELVDLTPVASNVAVYAEIVRQKHQLRSLISAATDIANKGRDTPGDVGELLDQAQDIIIELANDAQVRSYAQLKDLLAANFEALEAAQDRGDDLTGLPSGFAELDKYTNGFQPSDLIIVAARPSMGKTSLAVNIAKYAATYSKLPAVVFSLEMSKEQLALRLLCSEASVDSQQVRLGKLDDFEWDKLAKAAGTLSNVKLFIDESPELNPMGIKTVARRIQAEHGLGLIVVDYLQLMRSTRRKDNREQEIADISRGLKAIAKEFKVPVLACAQLNREVEGRTDRRPRLSDLRESGAIEQDADLVMFLYRDEVYNPETEDQGIAEIHIAKHRNGPITTNKSGIRLAFIPKYTKFAALSLRNEQEGRYN